MDCRNLLPISSGGRQASVPHFCYVRCLPNVNIKHLGSVVESEETPMGNSQAPQARYAIMQGACTDNATRVKEK